MISQKQSQVPLPPNDGAKVGWGAPIAPRILSIGRDLTSEKAPLESPLPDGAPPIEHSPDEAATSHVSPGQAFSFRCDTCGGQIAAGIEQIGVEATCPHCSGRTPVPLPGNLAAITQQASDSENPGSASLEAPSDNHAPPGKQKSAGLLGRIKSMLERRKERARLMERRYRLTKELSRKEEETRRSQQALGKFGWEAGLGQELTIDAARAYRRLLAERERLEEESKHQASTGSDLEKSKSQGLADITSRRKPLLEELQKRRTVADEAGRILASATSAWEEERDAAIQLFEETKKSSEDGVAIAGSEDLVNPLDTWINPFREHLVATEKQFQERGATLAVVHSGFMDAKGEVALCQLAVRETQESLDDLKAERRQFEKNIDERVKVSKSAAASLEDQLGANSKDLEEALVQIGTALFSLQPGGIADSGEFAALAEAASELDHMTRRAKDLDRHIEQLH